MARGSSALYVLIVLGVSCGGSSSVQDSPVADAGTPSGDSSVSVDAGAAADGQSADRSLGAGDSAVAACGGYGEACQTDDTCCSSLCDKATRTCTSTLNNLVISGAACSVGTDCQTLSCVAGACSSSMCISDGQACGSSAECCSGTCSDGTCKALNLTCATAGNSCTDNAQCCSKLCTNGTCRLDSSFCIQEGDACSTAFDCCSGVCNIAQGARIGVCGPPPTGASYCSGSVDGKVCEACNDCCSRLCEPYGPTGVKVCQRASGCHVNGDLCRKNSDCCGAAGTGLPGDGNVECEILPGQAVGVCRNPRSCNPEGNVCHYKETSEYTCQSVSSARNDCCAAVGNSGVCKLDRLGVPRCYGLGDQCRKAGESCAMAADCCDGVPCIPNEAGQLVCMQKNDAGVTCSPRGGACTINGDCCSGYVCTAPLGSTQGTCETYTSVPPTPGSAGEGGTAPGDAASGSAEAGAVAEAGATAEAGAHAEAGPGPGNPPVCSFVGQSCLTAPDCCANVPCVGASGLCQAGETNCICYQLPIVR